MRQSNRSRRGLVRIAGVCAWTVLAVGMGIGNPITEEGLRCIGRVVTISPTGEMQAVGSGIVVQRGRGVFFVSAKHVFDQRANYAVLTPYVLTESIDWIRTPLMDDSQTTRSLVYTDLPDVDICAIRVDLPNRASPGYRGPVPLPEKWIWSDKYARSQFVGLGSPGYMIGYPDTLHDFQVPVFRSTRISSIPRFPYSGRCTMLVDSPCIPGNSGSPVMIEIGSNGIYSGAPNLDPPVDELGQYVVGIVQATENYAIRQQGPDGKLTLLLGLVQVPGEKESLDRTAPILHPSQTAICASWVAIREVLAKVERQAVRK
jgi:hypothetical protein